MTDLVKALLVVAVLVLPLTIGWDLIEFGDLASTDGLLIGVMVGVVSLLARIGWVEWRHRQTGAAPAPRSVTWLRAAVIGLIGPIVEELLYRGLLQPQMGLLITASFFAIGHAVMSGPITTGPISGFLGGLLLGLIARDFGLASAMVAHVGINLSALFVSAVYLRKFPSVEIGDDLIAELEREVDAAQRQADAEIRDRPGWWFVRGVKQTDQPDTCEASQWFAVYVAEWENALPAVVQDYDGTREPVQKLIEELEADYLEWSGPLREPPEDREADPGRLN